MEYTKIETHYGPAIHFNDWRLVKGNADLVSAGGAIQIFTEETANVMREEYPLAGGGDVETTLRFNFERTTPESSFTFYFNKAHGVCGFHVEMTKDRCRVIHQDKTVYDGRPVAMEQTAIHSIKLVTLDETYTIIIDGTSVAEGRMNPPYNENEGRLGVLVKQGGLRILECEENNIARNAEYPKWKRGDILYEESFGQASLDTHWTVNGETPTVTPNGFTWHPMSVGILHERFSSPIAVDCTVTPQTAPERFTSVVTDAIFIWMIENPDGDLFEFMKSLPDANLQHYLPLPFYWVDFGGSNNKTTRFRKNPERHLIRQFIDPPRLMERDKTYRVTLVQNRNVVEFWVDGNRRIQAWDPTPYTEGYVGFRAYVAGLALHELKVSRIHG